MSGGWSSTFELAVSGSVDGKVVVEEIVVLGDELLALTRFFQFPSHPHDKEHEGHRCPLYQVHPNKEP